MCTDPDYAEALAETELILAASPDLLNSAGGYFSSRPETLVCLSAVPLKKG